MEEGLSVVVDTSVVMRGRLSAATCKYEKVYVPLQVVQELDRLKSCGHSGKEYGSRRGIRELKGLRDEGRVEYVNIDIGDCCNTKDEEIIHVAKRLDCILLTFDLNMSILAEVLGVDCICIDVDSFSDYKGYREVYLDSGDNRDMGLIQDLTLNKEIDVSEYPDYLNNLRNNEYVIFKHKGYDEEVILIKRYSSGKFKELKTSYDVIIPKDPIQECALDMLLSDDIKVKCIFGKPGSGKTYMSVKVAEKKVSTGLYDDLILVRNPIGPGEDIGFLKGDKDEKIEDYFNVFTQHMSGNLSNREVKMEIPRFMKGLDLKDSLILVDEAEDLDDKILRMLGTRVSEGSSIVFTGDYGQAERKYRGSNAILDFVYKVNDPLLGYIELREDLRSDVSKLFGDNM